MGYCKPCYGGPGPELVIVQWGNIRGSITSQVDLWNFLGTKANISSLAAVAFSGDYLDLKNKPNIGAQLTLQQVTDNGNITIDEIIVGGLIVNGTGAFTGLVSGIPGVSPSDFVTVSQLGSAVIPGGSDRDVQFNDGGAFGGDDIFQWSSNNNLLIGTSTDNLTADLQILDSTGQAQLALHYSDSLYIEFLVDNGGNLIIAPIGGGVSINSSLSCNGSIYIATGGYLSWGTPASFATLLDGQTDGNLTLFNSGLNTFNLLQFGGTTSVYPAIKRNGTGLEIKLADDSSYSSLTIGTLTVNGTGSFTGLVSGIPAVNSNDFVTLSQISGSTYVLPPATNSTLGGIIVGANIQVIPNGTISLQSSGVTGALGFTPYNSTNPAGYISGNQQIILSGAVTGTGTTSIFTTIEPGLLPVPGGSNTDIQFNNSGSFGGSALLTWNGSLFFVSGNTQITSLSSTGTTMVVATSTGLLQTQPIPSSISLQTSGTTGAATLIGSVLNIPIYQGQITLTTNGTAGNSTLIGNTLNIPDYAAPSGYTLPPATTSTLGGVIVGANIQVTGNGTISLQSSGVTGALGYVPLDPSGTSAQYFAGNGQLITFPTIYTPGGANTDIQFNNSGVFGGTNALTWNGSLFFVSGSTQITSLASTGTTMVVATSSGLLSTQAIPAGAVSSVSNSDSSLTISPTTGAVIASLNVGHANTWTAAQTHQDNGLGATTASFISLINNTAASSGVTQVSPSLVMQGQGWKTTATASSQSVAFQQYVLPVLGAAAPTGQWLLQQSINGAAFANVITVNSNALAATFNSSGLQIPAGGISFAGGGNVAIEQFIVGANWTFSMSGGNFTGNCWTFTHASTAPISGTLNHAIVTGAFAPTSGTATYAAWQINPTINQTGGASGVTRGIYINPVLTAASNFRAIEVAAGKIISAASTTTTASFNIPTGSAPTVPVEGDMWKTGTHLFIFLNGATVQIV